MKSFISILVAYFLLLIASASFAQEASSNKVIVTGVRFAYPLVEKWIQNYKAVNPSASISIETRTTTDPTKYDLLIEAYEPERSVKETRDYLYIGRYALLPVANASSAFAKTYHDKGLTNALIKQLYFHDILADKDKRQEIKAPYTIYTRLQKAGAPVTFARYFGYEQQNISGKAIAGADEHLIKALLKDSTGVSYGTLGLLYNPKTRKPLDGLSVLPVDLDDNGRISNDEKIFDDLETVITRLEDDKVKNVPIEYLHISLSKISTNPDALKFLLWIIDNAQEDLHSFGYLKPEIKRFEAEKEKFLQRAAAQ
jgi:ABC-type phosphate transport system substrate-binding protein